MPTPPSLVFQVPELAQLIFELLRPDEVAPLVSVSKQFFRLAAPSRWKHVTSATPLLRLLPCAETEATNYEPRIISKVKLFTLPKPLAAPDFRRFYIYAPYIKRLNVFKGANKPIAVHGLDNLLAYVNCGHVLLPKLDTLALQTRHVCREVYPYYWIAIFSSPGLRALYVSKRLARVSLRVGSAILDHLVRVCPGLTTLDLYLVQDGGPEEDDSAPPSLDASETGYVVKSLWMFRRLENLIISSFFLETYFADISQMPVLRRLEVRYLNPNTITPISLSDDAFPVLRELKLNHFQAFEVVALWTMPRLVENLTTLELLLRPGSQEHDLEPLPDGSLLRFFTALVAGSPQITLLTLDFDPEGSNLAMPVMFDGDSLRMLSRLPLRSLSIRSAGILLYPHTEATKFIVAHFPNLEVFQWPNHFVGHGDLHRFGGMPNLRYLAVCVERMLMIATVVDKLPRVPPPGNTPLRVLESQFFDRDAEAWFKFATYISHLWPNVQLATQERRLTWPQSYWLNGAHLIVPNAYMKLLERQGRGDRKAKIDMWKSAGGERFDCGLEF